MPPSNKTGLQEAISFSSEKNSMPIVTGKKKEGTQEEAITALDKGNLLLLNFIALPSRWIYAESPIFNLEKVKGLPVCRLVALIAITGLPGRFSNVTLLKKC